LVGETKKDRNFKLVQGLGNKKSAYTSEEDRIYALTFDHSGQYLSVGDHYGRVIIFKFKEADAEGLPYLNFYDEILAFEPDYDFAGLIEIPSTINALTWVPN
jgi:hypothetical protein